VIHVCNADGSHDTVQAIDPAVIPDVTWRDERAFYYPTVVESAKNRTETSYLHAIGSRSGDAPIAGFGVKGPMGSQTSRDLFVQYLVLGTDAVLAMPQHDVTPHKPVFVAPFSNSSRASAPWRRIFGEDDQLVQIAAAGRNLYALSDRGDLRRTIVVRDRSTGAHVLTIAPHGGGLRTDIFANRTGVYVAKRVGAEMLIEHYDLAGRFLADVALPKANTIMPLQANPDATSFALVTATFSDPGRGTKLAATALPYATPVLAGRRPRCISTSISSIRKRRARTVRKFRTPSFIPTARRRTETSRRW
jgi:hypothetical protein